METRERAERMLERSGRITPREVLEAYRRTGLKPACGEWYDAEGGTACALTALGLADGLDAGDLYAGLGGVASEFMDGRFAVGFGVGYEDAFVSGFDGDKLDTLPAATNPIDEWDRSWAVKGWLDGRRAARFVFPA